ncbi:MAG: DUF2336 domain-containing protein [Candidatus Eiseniibacteriota bacterium]
MARDKSVKGRTALAGVVSELFFESRQKYSAREIELMTDILGQLIRDVEMSVRHALAEKFATRKDAPHDLLLTLANDEIKVAHPILMQSPVLKDEELIEIISHRTSEHQLAIALRQSVSARVSDALVAAGDEGVIKTLLENNDAEISQSTMDYLVEQSRRLDSFQKPLLDRKDLTPELAKRMYWWVSAALREHILQNYDIDEGALDGTIEETVKDIIAETRTAAQKQHRNAAELVEHLHKSNALTPKFLIQVLREGEIPLFEAMFSKVTGLSAAFTKRVLYEPGGLGLAVACRATNIDKPDFASIFLLSRQGRPGDKTVDPRELTKALSVYDVLDVNATKTVLARWRLEADYQKAIRDLHPRLATNSAGAAVINQHLPNH